MRYLAVQFHLDKFNTPTLSCLYTRTTHYHGLTQWLSDKESACDAENTGDRGSIPGLGRSHGEGNGNPLKNFCLENPMDRGGWWAAVQRVTKSWSRLKWLSTHTHTHTHIFMLLVIFQFVDEELESHSLTFSSSCCCWTTAHQAPPSMGFSRQEYWSGVPLPSPFHLASKWYFSAGVLTKNSVFWQELHTELHIKWQS